MLKWIAFRLCQLRRWRSRNTCYRCGHSLARHEQQIGGDWYCDAGGCLCSFTSYFGGQSVIVRPVTRDAANAIVSLWHSHHKPVRSHRFALGAFIDDPDELLGIVIVGNPTAQALSNHGMTMEVLRLCTDGHRNAASFLLGASWRAAKAMGVTRMVSYTRSDEGGTCYRAAGWEVASEVKGRQWDTGNKSQRWLPGLYEPTTEIVDRMRWEVCR